ncbi:MAG: hypothetical protein DI538_25445 [Azospira oryzae]|jgi:hypothetical protein|nr:hypothetical protein [Cytophaga sp.]PZR27716.1 MAG: hypothetical protein DI538_25445 [Azospira oryzae]
MKLLDTIIISLAVVFIIIGIYEVMSVGLGQAYWALMLAIVLYFVYDYRKNIANKKKNDLPAKKKAAKR